MIQAPPGQFLLVELEPELHHSRVAGIFHAIALTPGVKSVSDLSLTPLEHLAERILLRVPPEAWPREYQTRPWRKNIRAYWRRKRQPGLL